MELLVLLGLSMAVGTFALLDDDDNGGDSQPQSSEPPMAEATDNSDDLSGSSSNDTFFALEGHDLIEGRGGDDRLFGNEGNDFLTGGEGNDLLRGGSGDDAIVDGEGADTLIGDLGNDVIFSTSAIDGEAYVEFAREMADPDAITDFPRGVAIGNSFALAELEAQVSLDEDTDDAADTVQAGSGNDIVIAGDGDTISLGEGRDSLVIGDWMNSDDDPVNVTDFDPAEDRLVYSYDGDGLPPRLSVQVIGDGSGDEGQGSALLFADNVFVARIPGAGGLLSVSDISIVDRSSNGLPLS